MVPFPGAKIIAPARNNYGLTHRKIDFWQAGRWKGVWMGVIHLSPWTSCLQAQCGIRDKCFAKRMVNATIFDWKPLPIFLEALDSQLDRLIHKYREGISIELHASGDFPTLEYAEAMGERLHQRPNLLG